MMFRLSLLSAVLLTGGVAADSPLWFDAPASHFTEAVPLGNGQLGAMPFGGVASEHVLLNETGMWSGSPQDADRPDAAAALPEIRRLLLAGRNREAEALDYARFTALGAGSGWSNGAHVPYGCYQELGDLHLDFAPSSAAVHDYRRDLDLTTATATVRFEQDGVRYLREYFVSAPDQVVVIRLTADHPGALTFTAWLDRPETGQEVLPAADELLLTGQLDNGTDGHGVRFAARLRACATGGSVSTEAGRLRVERADEVVLLIAAATDIRTFAGRRADDPLAATAADVAAAAGRGFSALRTSHVADYRSYFDRVALRLGAMETTSPAPLPTRLKAFAAGASDPALVQLYFDFGRYLVLSANRPDGLPANLQGLWAEGVTTPWNGDWHLNINVQMNFWPVEVCNLPEFHEPLFALIGSLQAPGARTAQKYYGAHGWVAHVLANPWGFTSPGEGADWGATTTGSAWLCQHLWEHYLFTGDREFLARVYPWIRGSAQFYLDLLVTEPEHGWLVTAPSNSPENSFRLADGGEAHLCLGATFDQQIVRALFRSCIDAATILGTDAPLREELAEKLPRLAPTRIGPDGRILEWLQPYAEVDPHHRHTSHLWGLFPGNEIDPQRTPDLAAAARLTLEGRGDDGTGWSLAHKLLLWARLGDGDHAYRLLRNQLRPISATEAGTKAGGGTYPNLFDGHPPFQIDGNFGSTAGIVEMLLQSQAGEINLLPALPSAWPAGAVRGLRTREGCAVDLSWENGRLQSVALHALRSGSVRVRSGPKVVTLGLHAGETLFLNAALQPVAKP